MNQTGKFWFTALLLLLSFNICYCRASYTISQGQSLFGNQTIISEGGKFELGFFAPGNSPNYFLGVWYKNITKKAVVWIANRDKPISSVSTSELKLSNHGNLVLTQSEIPLWSPNVTSSTSGSMVALLLDSGNFVLRSETNSSNILWQSFDHPTDTWLPTQKIGLNRITGENHLLISWKNLEDPSTGIFAMGFDPSGTNQFFLWRNRTKYWGSGLWDGKTFTGIPGMEKNNYLSYHHVSNERENYFTFTPSKISSISRIVMDVDGQTKLTLWLEDSQEWLWVCLLPSDPCSIPSLCGGFSSCNARAATFCGCLPGFEPLSGKDWNLGDWSRGCVRRTPLNCIRRNSSGGEKDRFSVMSNIQLPVNSQYLAVASAEDCESACLNDCTCTAYSYSSLCVTWNDTLYDLKQFSSESGVLHLRLAGSEFPNSDTEKGGTITRIIILTSAAGFLLLLILVTALFWIFRVRSSVGASGTTGGILVTYSYKDLVKATNDFSEILGSGSFGTVFKGTLCDYTSIAVKRLKKHFQGEKQFRSEVSTIGLIRHVNLVTLCGFCTDGSERMLVYDYMPNGSLGFHLFRNESKVLDWATRYRIAIGIARGLAYLHEGCRDCIIHCDVKPENILLDEDFCPKVADFGLAKIVGREFSKVLTTIRGTLGYLAPEWISGSAITEKVDVYSYGMMLLEVISGRRNATQSEDEVYSFFPLLAAEKIKEDDIVSLLDYKLEGDADIDEARRACRVSLWCIQDEEKHRPTMSHVVQILEGIVEVDIAPTPKILQSLVADQDGILSYDV